MHFARHLGARQISNILFLLLNFAFLSCFYFFPSSQFCISFLFLLSSRLLNFAFLSSFNFLHFSFFSFLCCPEQIFFSVRLLKRSKEKQATHRPISGKKKQFQKSSTMQKRKIILTDNYMSIFVPAKNLNL